MNLYSKFDETVPHPGENWLCDTTRLLLVEAVSSLAPGARVLEIGSWLGRSACFLLERHPDISMICLDTWEGNKEHTEEQKKDLWDRFRENMDSLNYLGRITCIQDESCNIREYLEKASLDMIFIDGSHREDDVYLDVHNAYYLAKAGGIIVGDDWSWDDVSKGTMRAYWEINEKKRRFFFIKAMYTAYMMYKKE